MFYKFELKRKLKTLSYEMIDEELSKTSNKWYVKKLLKLKAKILKQDMAKLYPEIKKFTF